MKKHQIRILLLGLCLGLSSQTFASGRVAKGALVGGAVGAVAGNGMGDALRGAAIGGGVAAITDDGRRGRNARDGAIKGAVVGGVVGGVAGNGMDDAMRGAAWGAAGGAIIGNTSSRNRDHDRDDRYDHDNGRHRGNKHKYKD